MFIFALPEYPKQKIQKDMFYVKRIFMLSTIENNTLYLVKPGDEFTLFIIMPKTLTTFTWTSKALINWHSTVSW
jgi:hypothetical protein